MSSAGNPPQAVIELTFGPLVSGIWMQQLLLGFILAQMVDYYRFHVKTDDLFNKVIVGTLLVLNVLVGGIDFHVLYRAAVLHYGVYEFFDLQEWTMWTEPGWTAIIGFVAQTFFLVRCYKINRSWIITSILGLLVLFALGSGLAVSGSFIADKRFSSLGQFTLPIELWLLSTSACDIIIAGVLCFHLWQSRTSFKKTNSILTRIIVMSMETSSTTAIVAVLNLVLFLPLQNTAYHLLPQFSMSRVYTLTVMVTLLARSSLRDGLGSGTTYNTFGTTFKNETAVGNNTTIRVGVQKSVVNDDGSEHNHSGKEDIELGNRSKTPTGWNDRKVSAF